MDLKILGGKRPRVQEVGIWSGFTAQYMAVAGRVELPNQPPWPSADLGWPLLPSVLTFGTPFSLNLHSGSLPSPGLQLRGYIIISKNRTSDATRKSNIDYIRNSQPDIGNK